MNKFQAMAQAMALLNEDDLLKPGSKAYKIVRKMISDTIDSLGPDAAIVKIRDTKADLLTQIKIMRMWHLATPRRPSTKI